MQAEQLELFSVAQATEILLKARREVMNEWQHEVRTGMRKPPSAEAFETVTHAINKINNRG